jgi:hypothetical protein
MNSLIGIYLSFFIILISQSLAADRYRPSRSPTLSAANMRNLCNNISLIIQSYGNQTDIPAYCNLCMDAGCEFCSHSVARNSKCSVIDTYPCRLPGESTFLICPQISSTASLTSSFPKMLLIIGLLAPLVCCSWYYYYFYWHRARYARRQHIGGEVELPHFPDENATSSRFTRQIHNGPDSVIQVLSNTANSRNNNINNINYNSNNINNSRNSINRSSNNSNNNIVEAYAVVVSSSHRTQSGDENIPVASVHVNRDTSSNDYVLTAQIVDD